jgi:hypothetical protein
MSFDFYDGSANPEVAVLAAKEQLVNHQMDASRALFLPRSERQHNVLDLAVILTSRRRCTPA